MARVNSDEMQRELSEHAVLADAGEAAAVVLHELGNVLNNLLLDGKLLQKELPEEFHHRIADNCSLITAVSKQMKLFAQFRHACRAAPYRVDLNQVIRNLVSKDSPVQLHLQDAIPPIAATYADLSRVIRLLLKNALAVQPADAGAVCVETAYVDDRVSFSVRDNRPVIPAENIHRLFEPFQSARIGGMDWALPICKNLVRIMKGHIEAISDESGCQITVTWPIFDAECP